MQRLTLGISGMAALIVMLTFSFASASGYNYNSDQYYNYDNGIYGSYNSYNNLYGNNGLYNYGYPYNTYSYNNYPYNYYNQRPNCSITITRPGSYSYGGTIQIAWSSSYATSAYISGIGSVGTNGSQAIYYPYNSFYTMTVYGPGGTNTCTTQNDYYSNTYSYNYSNSYYPYNYTYPTYSYATPSYTYPAAYTYVNLNQIPYTGYDFGTLGNSIYWLTILLAALGGAYLIVYFHGGVQMREFAKETVHAARNQLRTIRSIVR